MSNIVTNFLISSKRLVLFVCFSLLLLVPIFADVIFLVDGKILIGSVIGFDEAGIAYSVLGERIVLNVDQILKTEQNIQAISDLQVNVHLKDGSTLHGRVVDFDEEIGFFVDIGFGTLIVPIAAVSEIVDPTVRVRYAGSTISLQAGGGAYLPLFTASENFGPSWVTSLGADVSLPFFRGMYAGISFSVSGADYTPSDSVSYLFASVTPDIGIRYMGWRMRNDFLRIITPYVSLSGGASYISMTDPVLSSHAQGSLSALFGLSGGLRFAVAKGFSVMLDLFGDLILQKSSPFVYAGAGLLLACEQ